MDTEFLILCYCLTFKAFHYLADWLRQQQMIVTTYLTSLLIDT
jgi:hypothetical protein